MMQFNHHLKGFGRLFIYSIEMVNGKSSDWVFLSFDIDDVIMNQ